MLQTQTVSLKEFLVRERELSVCKPVRLIADCPSAAT